MNEDLERLFDGSEEDFRSLVATLRTGACARVPDGFSARVMEAVRAEGDALHVAMPSRSRFFRPESLLPLAACLALVLAFVSVIRRGETRVTVAQLVACQRADGSFTASSAAPYAQAFAVKALAADPAGHAAPLASAVAAIVRDQNAEGGWCAPDVSARNVAALAAAHRAGVAGVLRAYKRGVRYLHAHGIGELSSDAFAREARAAVARLSPRADSGLFNSVALCAR